MILELGKQYIRRDGKVTDPLQPIESRDGDEFIFWDPKHAHSYKSNGCFGACFGHHYDLVAPAIQEAQVSEPEDPRDKRIEELEETLNHLFHYTDCTSRQMDIIEKVLPRKA